MLTSLSNEQVKLVRALQTQRKTREQEKRFVIEGVRLIEEALKANADFDFVFYEETKDERARKLLDELTRRRVSLIQTSTQIMRACADTENPQGVIAVLALPSVKGVWRLEIESPIPNPQSLILICDRISDPGNLGTLLRTAAAANVDAVLLSPDTVEAFNPKVVRAGMGAHFRLPIESLSWDEIKARTANLKIYLADAEHGIRTTQYDLVDWTQPCALIVCSEAEGASNSAKTLAQESVYIPMQRNVESLNAAVAGSIILFEAVRQRKADSEWLIADG